MSIYFAVCQPDRVEMLTDGASYLPDGTLVAVKQKVTHVESVPAAITTRGIAALGDKLEMLVKQAFDMAGSYDVGIMALERILDTQTGIDVGERKVEMAIAGISESKGPIVHFWSSVANWTADDERLDAFTLYSTRPGVVGGVVLTDDQVTAFRKNVGTLDSQWGIAAIEDLRRQKLSSHHTGDDGYSIGGHIDLTTVSRNGVTIKRIHTWSDRIGEKLHPEPPAKNVVALNRRQRRAAERAAQKGRAVA